MILLGSQTQKAGFGKTSIIDVSENTKLLVSLALIPV